MPEWSRRRSRSTERLRKEGDLSRRDYHRHTDGRKNFRRSYSRSHSRSRTPVRTADARSRRSRSRSPGASRRRRSSVSHSRSPDVSKRRRSSVSHSRSPVAKRRRDSVSRSRSRSRDRRDGDRDKYAKRRKRSESVSSASSSSSDRKRHKRKRDKKKKEGKRDESRERERREKKERKREKREKKDKKKHGVGSTTSQWGKYGIISDVDIFKKTPEFYTWLVEERKINPETISKDQKKKEFARYVEDFNTATLPHEKYYHMEAYERRMSALRQGEFLPPTDDLYDPQADLKAISGAHKRKAVEHESYLSPEQLRELRRVQNERIEAGKMKLLGMDVKQNMGVRMDGTMFDG